MSQKITSYSGFLGGGVFAGLLVSVVIAAVLSFTSSGATQAAGGKSYDAAHLAKVKEQFLDPKASLEDLSALYHGTVNDIFNDYIDAFTKIDQTSDTQKNMAKPPKDDKACLVDGSDMNVSTYCLYLRIDDLYQSYQDTLQRRQDTAFQEIQDILKGNNSQTVSSNLYEARRNWISREFELAKKALDGALKGYSELLTQYPLHVEYGKTIKLLVKYYDHLTDIRKKVDTYPARFHDVTTQDCN